MQDIIQKIVATEDEAKTTVEAARTEADRIVSDAQKKGQEIVDRARQEAFIEAERIIKAAVEKAEQEKETLLADAVAKVESQIQLEPASRKSAIEEVVRCVCE
jgi:vacuolar-type H+-ATPase subunit H